MKSFLFFALFCSNLVLANEVTAVKGFSTSEKLIYKGNVELSGGFAAETTTSDTTSLSVYPAVGYFVSDHLVVGTSASVSALKLKSSEAIISYGLGPYVAYYFYEKENWAFSISQYFNVSEFLSNQPTGQASSYAGAKYFISPRVAIAFELGMSYPVGPVKTEDGTSQLLGRYNIYY